MNWILSTHEDTEGVVVRDKETGVIVADCSYEARDTFTPKEQEKHAHLIAAAPELLEACNRLIDLTRNTDEFSSDTVTDALQAIRKAEGGKG